MDGIVQVAAKFKSLEGMLEKKLLEDYIRRAKQSFSWISTVVLLPL